MLLRKTYRFEASHILPLHAGKCSRLHGHSWVLHVWVEGKINQETGFVKDFAEISDVVKPIVELLDHRHLGQWATTVNAEGKKTLVEKRRLEWGVVASPRMDTMAPTGWEPLLYPSSENLLWWFGGSIKEAGLSWSRLALEETCTSYAELDRLEFESGVR